MSDTRAAIRELRSLSEKRSTQGLTESERNRLAELRDRLGLPSEPSAGSQGAGVPLAPREARAVLPPTALAPGSAAGSAPDPVGTPVARGTAPAAPPASTPVEPAPPGEVDGPRAEDAPPPLVEAQPAAPVVSPELQVTPAEAWTEHSAVQELAPEPAPVLENAELGTPTDSWPGTALTEAGALPLPAPDPLAERWAAEGFVAGTWTGAESPPAAQDLGSPELGAEPVAPLPGSHDGMAWSVADEPAGPEGLPGDEATEAAAAEVPSDTGAAELPSEAAAAEWPSEATAAEVPSETGTAEWPSEAAAAEYPSEVTGTEPAPETAPVPRRPSLAERIDAAVETESADGGAAQVENPGWGAVVMSPEDLGAAPLDVADPSAEPEPPDAVAPVELSPADVELLEPEPAAPLELGGDAADPVPLAAVHEFVGQQPGDDRALPFDEQDEPPTFAPEDLQATGAEAFFPAPPSELPERRETEAPELETAPPAPVAPRISVPKPPAGPPPPRPAPAQLAQPPAEPPRPLRPTPTTAPQSTPPPPPASPPVPPRPIAGHADRAFALGDDGSRIPALTAAPPVPPQLSVAFKDSGPFGRNTPLLLTPAPLDVMDDAETSAPEPGLAREPEREPEPPPATDVATGAEVFGGYLNPTFVAGEHRVVLHTLEGQVRRGAVRDLDVLDPVIRLMLPGRPPEAISAERVKAIFFMQEPGSPPPQAAGRRIRVGFSDGRQIVGFSEDVDAGEQGFFLVPADTRTHTARIYLFRAGIQSISAA